MTGINISYVIDQTKLFLGQPSKGRLSVLCAHSFYHTKYDAPAHWGLGEIDGLLVPPGKASNLLTDHLITG